MLTAAMLTACGSDDKSTGPHTAPPASIVISSAGGSIPVNGTLQFSAVVKDADGNVLTDTPTWSVVAGGGTIDGSTGLFTAGDSAGTFTNTVQAAVGSISSLSSVTVDAGALATITIDPPAVSLDAGATQQYTAVGRDAHGNVIAFAPQWSVVANGGTIDTAGLFTAGTTAGAFEKTVVATSGAITDSVSVTVNAGPLASIVLTPPTADVAIGATQQFTATGKDANNNTVALTTPTWSVEAGGGTVDTAGLFTAGTVAGEFANTVKVTSGAISATSTVTVTPGPLANLVLTPTSTTLVSGTTQQFTVVGTDANANVVPITPLWQVVGGGGSIDDNGLFTATTAGTFNNTVVVTAGTFAATASVTVTVGPLATITLSPASLSIARFSSHQFTAVGKDANGNVVPITPTWSTSSGAGVVISTGFYVSGLKTGTYTIFAKVGGITGSTSITVHS